MAEPGPRHVVIRPAAHTMLLAADRPLRLGCVLRDHGDLAVIDGSPGREAVLLPPGSRADLRAEDTFLVCAWDGRRFSAHTLVDGEPGAEVDVTVVPDGSDAFERVRGIFETDLLEDRAVAVFGVGSGGSFIVRELAKAGVGRFLLVDHDRLEVGNISRHECGMPDVGRLKVNAVRDLIHRHNPGAQVVTCAERLTGDSRARMRGLVRRTGADLLIGATDTRESRLLLNRIALRENLPLVLGGMHRRAYGGIVQRVVPGLTACYQCFVQTLPQEAADNEISSEADAAAAGYTDRLVAPQPGLSTDIVPVALHIAKLAVLDLLDGASPALRSLDADLVANFYRWANRREEIYAGLRPMRDTVDGMTVLRWYGGVLPRQDDCAVCSPGDDSFDDGTFGTG